MAKINFILILLSIIFYSCNLFNSEQCEEFDYKNFGTDTLEHQKNLFFTNKNDTLCFEITDYHRYNLKYPIHTFNNSKECGYGFDVEYECKKMNFSFFYVLHRNITSYNYSLCSYWINNKELIVKKNNEINLTEELRIDSMYNRRQPIKSFTIKNGLFTEFVDTLGQTWKKTFAVSIPSNKLPNANIEN